ncbi:MAG: hypothetical protein CMM44_07685 [Rhodospirillaceae bacterium]|nr:hypothetical protein [Rhodospirillaceae bacterium]|tara:strand:+ start:410 stop:1177 length:768 start_codon:yes stop_codon:yes gene_type:complete
MEIDFLGVPNVPFWLFLLLAVTTTATAMLGLITGTAGGLALLAVMANFFPPTLLVPIHTCVQLGVGSSRAIIMWRHIIKQTLIPFFLGATIGAIAGAQIYIALPTGILQGIIAVMIIVLVWSPRFTLIGTITSRFCIVGFAATFIGMFVSATGTMVASFVAGAAHTRQNHASTMAGLMAVSHITKLLAFGALGVAFSAYLPLIIAMIGCGVLGNYIGKYLLNKIPEQWFRLTFKLLMTALAIRLIYAAAKENGLF